MDNMLVRELAKKSGFRVGSVELYSGGSRGFVEPVGSDCSLELSQFADLVIATHQHLEMDKCTK